MFQPCSQEGHVGPRELNSQLHHLKSKRQTGNTKSSRHNGFKEIHMLKCLIKYSLNKFKLQVHYLISYLDVTELAGRSIVSCPINFSTIVHQDKQFQWIKWCF